MWVYALGPRSPSSSWVAQYGFLENTRTREKGLAIMFLDGAFCLYPGTTEADYRSLDRARSKGKWVHRHVFTRPYRLI